MWQTEACCSSHPNLQFNTLKHMRTHLCSKNLQQFLPESIKVAPKMPADTSSASPLEFLLASSSCLQAVLHNVYFAKAQNQSPEPLWLGVHSPLHS